MEAANNVSLIEHQHLTEMHENLKRKLHEAHRRDRGRMDAVRTRVLQAVVTENYDKAQDELRSYVSAKTKYPAFQERAERYMNHCCDLVNAIRTKRSFPGLASLSLSKQQEIHEKVLQHFEELKQNLKQIERVEREHRLNDIRSTVWVLRTGCQVAGCIALAAFVIDLHDGLFTTLFQVTNQLVDKASMWLVNLIQF